MPSRRPVRPPLSVEPLEDRATPALTLAVAPAAFPEGAGPAAATGTVTRTGSTAAAVTVALATSDPTEATVPAAVTIPAGQAAVTFPVAAVDDALADGPQAVVLRAAAPPPGPLSHLANGLLGESANDVALQPDGKIVSVGVRPVSGGGSNTFDAVVSRHLADGTPDPTFGTGGRVQTDLGGGVDGAVAVALQPDGKIVVGGDWSPATGEYAYGFAAARYNPDGTLDPTFGTGGKVLLPAAGYPYNRLFDIAFQPDGKLVLAGKYGTAAAVVRLTAAGAVDTGFGTNGVATTTFGLTTAAAAHGVAVGPDGAVVIAGHTGDGGYDSKFGVARFTPAGAPDPTFGAGGAVVTDLPGRYDAARDVAVLPDGRVVVVGQVRRDGNLSVSDVGLVRYTPAGGLDPTFGAGGLLASDVGGTTSTYAQWDVEPLPDGRLLVGALAARAGLAVYAPDGTYLAGDFAAANGLLYTALAPAPDGTAVVAGYTRNGNPVGTVSRFAVPVGPSTAATVTVTDDDQPQPPALTLTLPGPVPEHAGAAAGTGTLTRSGGDLAQPLAVALASSDATELTVPANVTFPAGQAAVTFPLAAVDDAAQDGDQPVTVTASVPGTAVTGPIAFQFSYGTSIDGVAAVAAVPDGRLAAAGRAGADFAVHRYRADGTLDPAWNGTGRVATDVPGGADAAEGVYVYPDGRVLAAGTGPGGAADLVLARYTPAGALAPTFDGDGKLTLDIGNGGSNEAWDVAVAADGRIVLAVTTDRGAATYPDFAAVRLNADGSRDATFGTNGLAAADFAQGGDRAVAVAVLPDGKVLVAGEAGVGGTQLGVVRFTAAGRPDPTFGTNGRAAVDLPGDHEGVSDLLVRPDGRVVLAGRAGRAGALPPVYDPALAQLTAAGAPDPAFGLNGVRVQAETAGTAVFGPAEAALQADGRVVAAGTVGATRDAARTRVMRFSPAGTLEDATAGPYSQSAAEDVAIAATGEVYVAYAYGSAGSSGWIDRYRTPPAVVSATATATVRDNEPFAAANDAYTVAEDAILAVAAGAGVRANDPVTAPIAPRAEVVSGPATGALTLNADGSFTYTPAANFHGTATFAYRVRDGAAVANPATVTVTVTPVNDAPVAVPDAYTLAEDTTLSFDLPPPSAQGEYRLDMVSEPGDPMGMGLTYNLTRPAYTFRTYPISGPGPYPIALLDVVNAANSADYWSLNFASPSGRELTPGHYPDAARYAFRAYNQPGLDVSGHYSAWGFLTGEFTVYQAVWDGNTLSRFAADFVQRGGGFTAALRGQPRFNYPGGPHVLVVNDADIGVDPLTAELVAGPANGALALTPDGRFTYTPNPNFSGTDTFTYRVFDGAAYSQPAAVALTATPVPDVAAVGVNGGAAQRSRVTELTVTFDSEVDAALLAQPGAFALTRQSDGAAVGVVTVSAAVVGGRTVAPLTVAGANTESGSLADGPWTLKVDRAKVRAAGGGPGMAADFAVPVHRLFGDANGDRVVDFRDYQAFDRNFGAEV